jgi:exosome complex component RRP43
MAALDKGKGRADEQQQAAEAATANGAAAIDADLFKRIQPGEYLARFLAQGYRPDGRELDEFRDASINVGSISSADGSALVRMGQTTVLCGVTAQIATPDILAANQGFLVVNVDLPPMCSSKFRPGPPSDEAQVLSSRIRNIALSWVHSGTATPFASYIILTSFLLLRSSLLSLKSLCIKPARAAWVIYCDLMCISYDGNITDAALLALVAALKNSKKLSVLLGHKVLIVAFDCSPHTKSCLGRRS